MRNKFVKMSEGEAYAKLGTIEQNIMFPLAGISGSVIFAELLMRCIADLSESVQLNLKKVIEEAEEKGNSNKCSNEKCPKQKKFKVQFRNYWNCKLDHLTQAIILTFDKKLSDKEKATLHELRSYRNELAHGNIVSLLKALGIAPEVREISKSGERNTLKEEDIIEVCLRANAQGFKECSDKVTEVIRILKKLFIVAAITK